MPLLPKIHFRWKEPKEYLQSKDLLETSELGRWHQFLMSLVCTACLMGLWFMSRHDPKVEEPLTLWQAACVAVFGGLFFTYGVPWMNRCAAAEVRVFDHSIRRMRGDSHWGRKFSEIETFRWDTHDGYATLTLTPRGCGKALQVGVPLEVSREDVSRFLLDRGIWQEDRPAGRAVSI